MTFLEPTLVIAITGKPQISDAITDILTDGKKFAELIRWHATNLNMSVTRFLNSANLNYSSFQNWKKGRGLNVSAIKNLNQLINNSFIDESS